MLELTVSEFVALLNQTLEYAYPDLIIIGELANFRVSKNKWVYFDLKDDTSTVKFFGTIYQLPGPLEDGMILKVRGIPKLHNLYGFSVNVQTITPSGEGSIRRAADLLAIKLSKEGLFDEVRKRPIQYPPETIGLIASKQSAAYADFNKILNARWGGINIEFIDVQVQGEIAPAQITAALEQFNSSAKQPDVLVLIRGGGSAEDLAAFSTEMVTRAVSASRIPTLIAIGHEIDVSLAERAADVHASTPSNAAELLVPDKKAVLRELSRDRLSLSDIVQAIVQNNKRYVSEKNVELYEEIKNILSRNLQKVTNAKLLLNAFDPISIMRRGYAIVRFNNIALRDTQRLQKDDKVEVRLSQGEFSAIAYNISKNGGTE